MKNLYLFFFALLITTSLHAPHYQEKLVVLAPYADPKNPGRTINGTYERGITLQLAEHIAKKIYEKNPLLHVIIIKPTNNQSAIENTSYANRLQPTLFCSLSCYQESSLRPQLSLYRYTHEGNLPLQRSKLALYPYDQAHRLFSTESKQMLQKSYVSLKNTAELHCNRPQALPFKPLLGIAAPAYGVEIGLPRNGSWETLAEPLALGIMHAVTT